MIILHLYKDNFFDNYNVYLKKTNYLQKIFIFNNLIQFSFSCSIFNLKKFGMLIQLVNILSLMYLLFTLIKHINVDSRSTLSLTSCPILF